MQKEIRQLRDQVYDACECHTGITEFGGKVLNTLSQLEKARSEKEIKGIIETCNNNTGHVFYSDIKKLAKEKLEN